MFRMINRRVITTVTNDKEKLLSTILNELIGSVKQTMFVCIQANEFECLFNDATNNNRESKKNLFSEHY